MKKFISLISVGALLLVVSDYAIGSGLRLFYFKSSSGLLYRTTFAMEKTTDELLIFGTSRANHHYNIKILEDSLGLSAYNTGRDGNFIFYQTAVLKSVLARYTPKQIILDFSGSFEYKQSDYDRLSSLLPYYDTHPEIRDIVSLKSPYERFKLKSKIYPYNSLATTISVGNMEFNKNRKNNKGSYKGFVPLTGVFESKLDSLKTPKNYETDSIKRRVFEEFILLTKEKNIPLIVVYSPVYYLYDQNYSIEICKRICRDNAVPFLDFSKDNDFRNNIRLFQDKTHLNQSGANIFTLKIAETLARSYTINYPQN